MKIMRPLIYLCISGLMLASAAVQGTSIQIDAPWRLPTPDHCVFSGEFDQTKELPGLENPLSSSGKFFHHCTKGIIWRTTTPVENSLIVDANQNAFQFSQGKMEKISGRAGKMIAQIIGALMSGNEEFILENFSITTVEALGEPTVMELTPLSKRLKRAINSIQLFPPTEDAPAMRIVMRDANALVTIINVVEDKHYPETLVKADCVTLSGYTAAECDQLFAVEPN